MTSTSPRSEMTVAEIAESPGSRLRRYRAAVQARAPADLYESDVVRRCPRGQPGRARLGSADLRRGRGSPRPVVGGPRVGSARAVVWSRRERLIRRSGSTRSNRPVRGLACHHAAGPHTGAIFPTGTYLITNPHPGRIGRRWPPHSALGLLQDDRALASGVVVRVVGDLEPASERRAPDAACASAELWAGALALMSVRDFDVWCVGEDRAGD